MTTTARTEGDSLITGFKPFFLITFLVAAVWVGVSPILIPAYVLSVTGSATDVALVLSLMALGAFAVPVLANAADRTRAHRPIQPGPDDDDEAGESQEERVHGCLLA